MPNLLYFFQKVFFYTVDNETFLNKLSLATIINVIYLLIEAAMVINNHSYADVCCVVNLITHGSNLVK